MLAIKWQRDVSAIVAKVAAKHRKEKVKNSDLAKFGYVRGKVTHTKCNLATLC